MRKLVISALILMLPAVSMAQSGNRSQTWDWSVAGIYQNGQTMGGDGGSQLKLKNTWGLGFNIGYNFNNRFTLGADFDFLRPGFDATLADELDPNNTVSVSHTASQFNGRLKGTLNLTDGPLVPYVEAGFGWTYFDSNVADGPPQTGCWWHPWWGYICSNYYRTFSSTNTSYGGALGLRYELRGGTFIKASYNYWKMDIGGGNADPILESARIEYGWSF
jgi:opacity protein-like surface antigen